MPIYEYKCLNCGNQLEVMQKISDTPLQECSNCQGKLEKQWSLSGFQFKGTGWYVSDYGKQGAEADRKSEDKTPKAAEGGSDSKSEKGSDNNSANSGAKNSADGESTSAKPSASKTESKPAEPKPAAKTD